MATSAGPFWARLSAALLAAALTVVSNDARAQGCDSGTYGVSWFGSHAACTNSMYPQWNTCLLTQTFSCGSGEPVGEPRCVFSDGSGQCMVAPTCSYYWPLAPPDETRCSGDGSSQCAMRGTAEVCGDEIDNNYDGCIDENCTKGKGRCSCAASCNPAGTCQAPAVSTCNPFQASLPERCGDGVDNNCNGLVDEGCAPKEPNSCGAVAGKDPILLFTRSAVTEPFTDFSVEALARLTFTRTYTSADASLQRGPIGIFGRGWHHDWEATLSCDGDYCTIARGIQGGFTFRRDGAAQSLDGRETWDIYRRGDTDVVRAGDGNGLLVRRPTGIWIYFAPDGTEQHFATACDTCNSADATCVDPRQGGVARLVDVVDAKGTQTHVAYDRAAGVLLGLSDDLGHSLEVRGASACSAALANELRYDGAVVATYAYSGVDLERAVDADGNVLRRYFYFPGGLLQAVVNEGGGAIAEFAYDANGDAVSVIDGASDVAITYSVNQDGNTAAQVTERYDQTTAISTRELDHDGHPVRVTGEASCGRRASTWRDRNLECSDDEAGTWTYRLHDGSGRETYAATYPKTDVNACPPWQLPSLNSSQEWYGYAVVKEIASGVSLPLDVRTATSRRTSSTDSYFRDMLDYDPAPNTTLDPPGYQCAAGTLPAGAVVCRRMLSGNTDGFNGAKVPERHVTFYSYDARGRLVRTYGPVNLDAPSAEDVTPIEERTYWSDAESLARRGRLHEVKRYPTPTTPPLVTTIDYDAFGPYSITSPLGTTTLLIKDGRGRTRYTVSAGQRVEARFYDGSSPRLTATAGGGAIRTSYDERGRVKAVEYLDGDPEASGPAPAVAWSEHTTYDPAGNAMHVERRDATGAVSWQRDRHFDILHRVTSDAHPERPGVTRSWTYDAAGNLTAVSDEDRRTTTFTPDAWRRVASVTMSGLDGAGAVVSGNVASYRYDPAQGSLFVADGKGANTQYQRDDFGQVTHVHSPVFRRYDSVYYFRYDARGNLVERRADNQTLRFTYDGLDRLTSVLAQECGGSDTSCTRANTTVARIAYEYRYDENGNAGLLTSISDATRTVRFEYDAAGRFAGERIEEAGVPALVTGYEYGADGQIARITYPSGLSLQVDRDRATGQVRKLTGLSGALTFTDAIERWPAGPLRSLTFGNGERLSANVNRRYEPVSLRSGPLALDYVFTASGDVERVVDGAAGVEFRYDYRDRLVSVSPGAVTARELVHQYATSAYTSERTDRIISSSAQSGSTLLYGYGYDQQGNLSSIGTDWINGAFRGGICLRHDVMGRLALVGPGNNNGPDSTSCYSDGALTSVSARFVYDAQNRRVARWSAATGDWTYFVHGPGGELLSELRKTGDAAQPWAPVRDYVWLDGRPVAQVEYVGTTARPYYVHADHLGTPRKLTSPERTVVWSAAMQPYGEVEETTTPDPVTGRTVVTNLRLPGQYDERLLGSIGLQGPYYNWNRWYLPSMGRYMELDPLALGGTFNTPVGVDWYGYALGNPIRFSDPTGLCSVVCSRDPHVPVPAQWLCFKVSDEQEQCPWYNPKKYMYFRDYLGFFWGNLPANMVYVGTCANWDADHFGLHENQGGWPWAGGIGPPNGDPKSL